MTTPAAACLWPRTCGWRAAARAERTRLEVRDGALVLQEGERCTVLVAADEPRTCTWVPAAEAVADRPWSGDHGWWVVSTPDRRWFVRVSDWLPAPGPPGPASLEASGVLAATKGLGVPLGTGGGPPDVPKKVLRPAFQSLGPWRWVQAAWFAGPGLTLLALAATWLLVGPERTPSWVWSALLWPAALPLVTGTIATGLAWAVWTRRGRQGPARALEVLAGSGRPSMHRFDNRLVAVDDSGRWTALPLGDHPGALARVARGSTEQEPALVLVDRLGSPRLSLPERDWAAGLDDEHALLALLERAGLSSGDGRPVTAPETALGRTRYEDEVHVDPEPTGLPHPATVGMALVACLALGVLTFEEPRLPTALALVTGAAGLTVRWVLSGWRKIARAEQRRDVRRALA